MKMKMKMKILKGVSYNINTWEIIFAFEKLITTILYDILVKHRNNYEIHGQFMMLDRDLAAMYGIETMILTKP